MIYIHIDRGYINFYPWLLLESFFIWHQFFIIIPWKYTYNVFFMQKYSSLYRKHMMIKVDIFFLCREQWWDSLQLQAALLEQLDQFSSVWFIMHLVLEWHSWQCVVWPSSLWFSSLLCSNGWCPSVLRKE